MHGAGDFQVGAGAPDHLAGGVQQNNEEYGAGEEDGGEEAESEDGLIAVAVAGVGGEEDECEEGYRGEGSGGC